MAKLVLCQGRERAQAKKISHYTADGTGGAAVFFLEIWFVMKRVFSKDWKKHLKICSGGQKGENEKKRGFGG